MTHDPVNCLAVSGTNLFDGTWEGNVFLLTNNGSNWIAANTGLLVNRVWALAVSGTNLFAGTGNGVWRTPLSEMIPTSVEQLSPQLPERYLLLQNYPNPFNPATTIEYNIPKQSLVTLKIFDLLGREMAVLVNEKKEAGRYSVQWDATAKSSGIYFYTLQEGVFRETKRMILIR